MLTYHSIFYKHSVHKARARCPVYCLTLPNTNEVLKNNEPIIVFIAAAGLGGISRLKRKQQHKLGTKCTV